MKLTFDNEKRNNGAKERLVNGNPETLSDQELLALIMQTGNKGNTALDVAMNVLLETEGLYGLLNTTMEELVNVDGVGNAKATQVLAMAEMGKRLASLTQTKYGKINGSDDLGRFLVQKMKGFDQENFVLLCLNNKNEIIKQETVFVGTLNQSVAHPRDIFRTAVKCSAGAIVVAHNHPSGKTDPSRQDITFTERLEKAGEMMGIKLLDHFIIGGDSYLSLREEGVIKS